MSQPKATQSQSTEGVSAPLKPRRGLDLRTKLMLLVVGVVCFLVVFLVILGCRAISQTGDTAQQISRAALESQAKSHLLKFTVENASRRYLELERTMAETKLLADTLGRYHMRWRDYYRVGKGPSKLVQMPEGHHVEGTQEKASIHVSKHVKISKPLEEHIRFSRTLDPLATAILESESKTSAVYLISDKEMVRYYPKGGLKLPPGLRVKKVFNKLKQHLFTNKMPECFWTEVYRDPNGVKMVTAVSTVFGKDGNFIGVIGMDYLLSDIGAEIEKTALVEGSYSFLIDAKGKSIALPEIAYQEIFGREPEEGEYGVDLNSTGGQMNEVITAMRNGDKGIQRITDGGTDRFVAYAPVGDLGWSLATVVSNDTIYRDVASLEEALASDISALTFGRLVPLGLLILVAFSLVASYLAYSFTKPLRQLTKAASAIAAGESNVEMPVDGTGEVGVLGKTLAEMTTRLKASIGTLESSVSERTSELRAALQKLEKTSEQLKHRADHDELTGLWNRRGFSEELESRLAKHQIEEGPAHLMILDLDRFKVVNDTCGHAEGDRLLCEIAAAILSCLGSNDLFARIGGDEFAVLLPSRSNDEATVVAEKILEEVQNYEFYSDSDVFKIGVSIGLVSINDVDVDINEVQQLADTACYAAKKAGRNRVHIAGTNDLVEEHRGEMRWVQRMYEAMDNDLFALFGQQIQPLDGSNDQGYVEVLLRLRDETSNQLIVPDAFLPAAERFGMMHEIDMWVVSKLIESLQQNQEDSSQQRRRFFVNLSGASLGDPEFCERLLDLMRESEFPAGTINFEVTETVVIRSMGVAKALIDELRDLGCKIALDDFGSGVSSLMYVKELQVDYLKIDGSFIQGVAKDEVDNIFVKSVIDIAHLSGMKTIAEYVENEEVKKIVKSLGADFGQGFGIHEPEELFPVGSASSSLKAT